MYHEQNFRLVKLDADENKCRIIFYEKSRIKSLIFLILDLNPTEQKEIIDEMALSLFQVKETNKNLTSQMALLRKQIQDKDATLRNVSQNSLELEKHFAKQLQNAERTFLVIAGKFESSLSDKLQKMHLRHLKLLCDLERVKADNQLKCESSSRLVRSMQNLRLENEANQRTIGTLKLEMEKLNASQGKLRSENGDLRVEMMKREEAISELKREVASLKKDNQEAVLIIQQKNKTHDEIAKDLVQANSMIVNFNNHFDSMGKEIGRLKGELASREGQLKESKGEVERVKEEFSKYRNECKKEVLIKLREENTLAKVKIDELEKQLREALKCKYKSSYYTRIKYTNCTKV